MVIKNLFDYYRGHSNTNTNTTSNTYHQFIFMETTNTRSTISLDRVKFLMEFSDISLFSCQMLFSQIVTQNKVEVKVNFWRKGSTSIAIPPMLTSDIVGHHHKTVFIFITFLVHGIQFLIKGDYSLS